jgi:hypothetical protein
MGFQEIQDDMGDALDALIEQMKQPPSPNHAHVYLWEWSTATYHCIGDGCDDVRDWNNKKVE